MTGTAARPLEGIRVLDLSWLLPGPFATGILADLGADVIKIERPQGGDYLRELSPELFAKANAGKRSVALDLKNPAQLQAFDGLVATADVLVEGFRPGVAARLGVDARRLSRVRPGLIHVSLTGYGQTGPLAQRAGHDINYLALAGALSIPGHWGEKPRRSGLPVADLAASLYCVINVLLALRQRDAGGPGATIDLAVADSALHWCNTRFGEHAPHRPQDPWGHVHPANDVLETQDGATIAVGLIETKFWSNFCDAAGRPDLRGLIERHDAQGKRQLREALATLVRSHPLAHWQARFARHDVPYSLVNTPAQALAEPQFVERGLVATALDSEGGAVPAVALPGRAFGRTLHEAGAPCRAPALGEHTRELLACETPAP